MTVQLVRDKNFGQFFIEIDGVKQAKMTFIWKDTNKFLIDHTEVNEVLRGKGAGKQLLMKAVAYARENNLKIIPVCSYVKSVFDKTPEIKDVLDF